MKCSIFFLVLYLQLCQSLLADGDASVTESVVSDMNVVNRLRGGGELLMDGAFFISEERNGTTISEESDDDSMRDMAFIAVILGSAVVGVILFYCCCCRKKSTRGYYNGKPEKSSSTNNFDSLEEEVPRSSMDDITATNTAVNAYSRFSTAEQYIKLFKGNYKHLKSRRTSAHAYRLGLNTNTPLIHNTRVMPPAEIELMNYMTENEGNEEQKLELVPMNVSDNPKKWVHWVDQTDALDDISVDNIKYDDNNDADDDDDVDGNNNIDEHEVEINYNDTFQDSGGFEWIQPNGSQKRKTSLVLTTADITDNDDVKLKVTGYNSKSILSSATGSVIADRGKQKYSSSQSAPVKYELSLSTDKSTSHEEKKKRLQNIFKRSTLSVGGSAKLKLSGTLQKVPTEEPSDEPETMLGSNFPNRGFGQCKPTPTRLSPPPPAASASPKMVFQPPNNHDRNQEKKKSRDMEAFAPIGHTGDNHLMRQNKLEPEKLGAKLKKMQRMSFLAYRLVRDPLETATSSLSPLLLPHITSSHIF